MEDKDIYMLSMATIIWIFASLIYLFEECFKTDNKYKVEEDNNKYKRNFRTVHSDNRKNFKNLINDDGTPYANYDFTSAGK